MKYISEVQEVLDRQITRLDYIHGRKVVYSHLDDELILVFDDGSFVIFTRYSFPEGGGGIELGGKVKADDDFYLGHLVTAGVISQDLFERQDAANAEWYRQRKEGQERKRYAELRKKFG